jgi:hypothetical protein
MLLWVNTHGSWIIGMAVILVHWMCGLVDFRIHNLAARRWTLTEARRISFAFLLCLMMLPITPYGTRIAASPFEFAFSLPLNIEHIEEWQSMSFSILGGQIFLVLVLGIFVVQVLQPVAWRLEDLALFLFGTTMACLHVRFLLVFVPLFVPPFVTMLKTWVPPYDQKKDKFILNALLMVCVVVAMTHFFPTRAALQGRVGDQFPMAAVEYLENNRVPEPTFNNYGFGGYLVLNRGPEHKVFIDGRGDLYERGGVFSDYLHISLLEPGALDVLRDYRVKSCLLKRDEPLATVLAASPNWQRTYVDKVSAIFVLRKPWN